MGLFQGADPFPDPTHAGQEIELVGFMFASILLIILMMYFMICIYRNIKRFLPALVVLLFSLVIGFYSLSSIIPFTPWFQIFFIVFQSVLFYLIVDRGDPL